MFICSVRILSPLDTKRRFLTSTHLESSSDSDSSDSGSSSGDSSSESEDEDTKKTVPNGPSAHKVSKNRKIAHF